MKVAAIIIAYLAVGGFLNGFVKDEKLDLFFVVFWPAILILLVFVLFEKLMYALGRNAGKKMESLSIRKEWLLERIGHLKKMD